MGFRAHSAGNRFLQVRKHGQVLTLHNSNMGVWESWALVDAVPVQPWDIMTMRFANRQRHTVCASFYILPSFLSLIWKDDAQFTLAVTVRRLGTWKSLNSVTTPRSLILSSDANDFSDNREVNHITQEAFRQWAAFMKRENAVRMLADIMCCTCFMPLSMIFITVRCLADQAQDR